MASKNLAEDPWERLANAIVLKAVDDYRAALRKLKRNPRSESAKYDVRELERFFRSGWYQKLTTVDGEFLIRRIREEIGL